MAQGSLVYRVLLSAMLCIAAEIDESQATVKHAVVAYTRKSTSMNIRVQTFTKYAYQKRGSNAVLQVLMGHGR